MAETMDRRKFLSLAASGVAVGALIALQACNSGSSDSSTTAPTTTTAATDKSGTIYSNHGHSVTLTAAQQQAGAAVTLTLSGGTHTHMLGLSATDVTTVAAGTRVSVESSVNAGHSHTVAFN